jgi:hypothetical protein
MTRASGWRAPINGWLRGGPMRHGETNAVNSAAFRRLNSPNFGRILSAAPPRLVQFAPKLMF